MAVNIEDAGFEIRDIVAWIYGSGFPKSHDISKAIDKKLGIESKIINTIPDRWTGKGNTYQYSKQKEKETANITIPTSPEAKQYEGWGTALKPAMELWTLARKPFKSTVAENVLKYGTGGINIDGCRVESDDKLTRPSCENGSIYSQTEKKYNTGSINDTADRLGRFPANVILSWPEEEYALKDNISSEAKSKVLEWLNENT
jgi:site-specific DNA-methyltransferase (adenine-specific)